MEPNFWFLILKMIVASFVVIGLAVFILKFVLPRVVSGRANKKSAIQILDFQAIDAKNAIYIVQIENKRVAVGATAHSLTKILDLPDTTEKSL